jgi:hypothetical protein
MNMQLIEKKLSELEPHPKNANRHSDHQLTQLKSSLKEFDQIKNIVVWNKYIIAGNGLFEAAKNAKLKTIKTVDVSDWDEEKALRFMVADNRLAELAEIDQEAMAQMVQFISDPLTIPGVDFKWLENFQLPDFEPSPEEEQPILNQKQVIKCPECGHLWEP